MNSIFVRLLKEPLLQFLLIGAGIYGAYALYGVPIEEGSDATLVVDQNRINAFVGQWKARWNRPPTRDELDGLINNYIREEVLYRQAVSMGLSEDDPVTRRRMAQKLEYLAKDLARVVEPKEGELEAWYADNQEQFLIPDRLSFSQIFFDPDARDEATLDDAATVLARLQDAGVPDPEQLQAGDQLMLQGYFGLATESDIRRQLGTGFATSVMELSPGSWHGPILSGYGVHLVYVYEHENAPIPAFAEVQERVFEGWQTEQMEAFNEEFYQGLKNGYEITIEDGGLGPESIIEDAQDAETSELAAAGPES